MFATLSLWFALVSVIAFPSPVRSSTNLSDQTTRCLLECFAPFLPPSVASERFKNEKPYKIFCSDKIGLKTRPVDCIKKIHAKCPTAASRILEAEQYHCKGSRPMFMIDGAETVQQLNELVAKKLWPYGFVEVTNENIKPEQL